MYDIVIVGGGPAGLAAAVAAKEEGIDNLIILEREENLGGTLNQCIHTGFGLSTFKEELTGTEYGQKAIDKALKLGINYKCKTTVLEISKDKELIAVNGKEGIIKLQTKAVILSTGCREMPRSTINIPGGHYAGIFTAGTAQKFINLDGYMPGKNVVIFGSGDIGLIMARRFTIEGAKVKAIVEPLHYCTGMKKNVNQCVKDFDIPLLLMNTITCIHGVDRVEGVTLTMVDAQGKPIEGSDKYISCDTIILAVETVSENELAKQAGVKINPITGGVEVNQNMNTTQEGIFASGNVVHYYDNVDNVTLESYSAGKQAADYVRGFKCDGEKISVQKGNGIKYVVPSSIVRINNGTSIELSFRVDNVYKNSTIAIYFDNTKVLKVHKESLAPGDLERIRITNEILKEKSNYTKVSIGIEQS